MKTVAPPDPLPLRGRGGSQHSSNVIQIRLSRNVHGSFLYPLLDLLSGFEVQDSSNPLANLPSVNSAFKYLSPLLLVSDIYPRDATARTFKTYSNINHF